MPQLAFAPVPYMAESLRRRVPAGTTILTESWHPPNVAIPPHRHAAPTLTFVVSGSFIEANASAPECDVRGLLYRPAGLPHRNTIGGLGAHTVGLAFHEDPFGDPGALGQLLPEPIHVSNPMVRLTARRLLEELRHGDDLSELAVESIACDVLVSLARMRRHTARMAACPPWFATAAATVHKRFLERGLSLSRVARDVGVAPATLARAFRHHYGTSVGGHLRRLRVERALQLMTSRQMPIAQAAAACGFADQSHLTRVCRAMLGHTPAVLRARRLPEHCAAVG